MRGCLRACMTASRTRRWEPGGKRSQTTKFGMRLPIFERWPPKEPGAWAAGSDEINALSNQVGAVDRSFGWNRDDRGCESGAHGEIAAPVQTDGYVDSPGHGRPRRCDRPERDPPTDSQAAVEHDGPLHDLP